LTTPGLVERLQLNNMPGALPISEAIHREVISLPMGPHLDMEDIHKVVDAVLRRLLLI
jgi:dTDP-4-amino-4,6-dideoxygalactose transaminase